MAYEMVMPYHLHMPSYFLETFTEYPYIKAVSLLKSRVDTAFMVGEECLVSDCSVVEVILSWLLVLPASVHGFYFGLQYKLP